MKILILGDIYGEDGKNAVASYLPFMKKQLNPNFVIANAENVSQGGKGLTKKDYDYLLNSGIDYFTMGNHTFRNKDIYNYIDKVDNLIRPANLEDEDKGKGFIIFKHLNKRILLFNLLGEVYISNKVKNPFKIADKILEENKDKYDLAILDIHAEATAEKIVLANYLSKKNVGIVFGTHTHIQTADERILNNKTAYITDVGMCGVFDSAIGANFDEVELKMSNNNKKLKFIEAKGNVRINAILVTLYDNSLKPMSIERIVINP
ncbi:MAG: metallophosphoesterase [Candidatus Tyloplasma litorale]|nr:MAG: metallophosphoesterase [Mycoplasmatales bacterium]